MVGGELPVVGVRAVSDEAGLSNAVLIRTIKRAVVMLARSLLLWKRLWGAWTGVP